MEFVVSFTRRFKITFIYIYIMYTYISDRPSSRRRTTTRDGRTTEHNIYTISTCDRKSVYRF